MSTSPDLAAGDWVTGPMMAQTHAQLPAAMFQKIDTDIVSGAARTYGQTPGQTLTHG